MRSLLDCFAARVTELIEEKGIRKSELSRVSGVSRVTIDGILAKKNSPSLETVEKISKAFGCSAIDLLKSSGPPPPRPHTLEDCLRVINKAVLGEAGEGNVSVKK